ncbi:hypothetical protein Hdeb2414_s0018g00522971 [Helianthus debilis subsp. tardiflorus]
MAGNGAFDAIVRLALTYKTYKPKVLLKKCDDIFVIIKITLQMIL